MRRVFHWWAALLTGATVWGAEPAEPGPKPFQLGDPVLHFGCCDASAGVAISSNLFLMANDEDNRLSLYRRDQSAPPVQVFAAGAFLHVDPHKPESDIEAATRAGDRIYWITSHGRNRSGEARESRHRFFATSCGVNERGGVELKTVGQAYTRLLQDLVRDPRLRQFNLLGASLRAPKEAGGLSIEGLCTLTNGELLIGFRNPIPGHRALLVPLKNPADLVAGGRAQFGDPILLDLGGLGVRDMVWANGRCLIIAGPYDGKGHFHLYDWDGGATEPRKIPETHFRDINPEALLVYPGAPANEFQLLSDDGTRKVNGLECKKINDPARRRFRSYRFRLE